MEKYRILVADDHMQFRCNLRDYLSARERVASVDVATDGRQTLDMLRSNCYDVLILDLVMPQVDGFGVLEQISAGMLEKTPVTVVVSAMRSEDMVRHACSLGARYFMAKPAEPDAIFRRTCCKTPTPPTQPCRLPRHPRRWTKRSPPCSW